MRRPVVPFVPVSPPSGAPARWRVAVACSALLHLLCASVPAPEWHLGRAPGPGPSVPIAVRLEPAPSPGVPLPVEEKPEEAAPAQSRRANALEAMRATRHAAAGRSGPVMLPRRADSTVYSAGEVDQLPAPVLPLDFSRLRTRAEAPTEVRLELLIDEHGTVSDVSLAGRAAAGVLERDVLGVISATAFVPARKDGRPVRARIFLSVDLVGK
jgi:protein TonB